MAMPRRQMRSGLPLPRLGARCVANGLRPRRLPAPPRRRGSPSSCRHSFIIYNMCTTHLSQHTNRRMPNCQLLSVRSSREFLIEKRVKRHTVVNSQFHYSYAETARARSDDHTIAPPTLLNVLGLIHFVFCIEQPVHAWCAQYCTVLYCPARI